MRLCPNSSKYGPTWWCNVTNKECLRENGKHCPRFDAIIAAQYSLSKDTQQRDDAARKAFSLIAEKLNLKISEMVLSLSKDIQEAFIMGWNECEKARSEGSNNAH